MPSGRQVPLAKPPEIDPPDREQLHPVLMVGADVNEAVLIDGNVADSVAFLAGPEGSYITGQVLRVNGGLLM